MAILTYLNTEYVCDTAIKGTDYIHLVDAEGCMIAAFDGITDFSAFSISDGDFTDAMDHNDCYVAVIREDGTVAKGGHKCRDIAPVQVAELPESGTALADDALYVIPAEAPVDTYVFAPPASGWCHGTFYTGTAPAITFASGSFLGEAPDFEASKLYEFDVMNGVWAFAEVVSE